MSTDLVSVVCPRCSETLKVEPLPKGQDRGFRWCSLCQSKLVVFATGAKLVARPWQPSASEVEPLPTVRMPVLPPRGGQGE